jgi:bifunctional DNase/RNase
MEGFMTTIDDVTGKSVSSKIEWIEVFPFGVAMSASNTRPVMIFKDKTEKRVLPVWLSHLDAGIAVTQGQSAYSTAYRAEGSPHEVADAILSRLNIKLDRCLFKEVRGHHQFVELHFISEGRRKKSDEVIEMRADDAISFCLRSGCKFFATLEYIERSRVLEGEMLMAGVLRDTNVVNPHPYLN